MGKERVRCFVPEGSQKRKATRVRSLRQRWIVNSVVPIFVLLALIVGGVSLGISNYYYKGMLDGLERQARAQSGARNGGYFQSSGDQPYQLFPGRGPQDGRTDLSSVPPSDGERQGGRRSAIRHLSAAGQRPGVDDGAGSGAGGFAMPAVGVKLQPNLHQQCGGAGGGGI